LSRDLDGGFIVVCIDPLRGRDLAHPIKAVKPVGCHFQNPNPCRRNGYFAAETTVLEICFNGNMRG